MQSFVSPPENSTHKTAVPQPLYCFFRYYPGSDAWVEISAFSFLSTFGQIALGALKRMRQAPPLACITRKNSKFQNSRRFPGIPAVVEILQHYQRLNCTCQHWNSRKLIAITSINTALRGTSMLLDCRIDKL